MIAAAAMPCHYASFHVHYFFVVLILRLRSFLSEDSFAAMRRDAKLRCVLRRRRPNVCLLPFA